MIEFPRIIEATFSPICTDDLRPEAAALIGKTLQWRAAWRIDDHEVYQGQWAYVPFDRNGRMPDDAFPGWVPECDLQVKDAGTIGG